MDKTNTVAGAGADRAERATECRQHRQILFQDGCEVKTNAVTGAKVLEVPSRRRPEIKARKYDVPGLRIFHHGDRIRFEFITRYCIVEPDCIDAQCVAGWDDQGYGFGGLDIGILPDGSHRATWSCGVCLD